MKRMRMNRGGHPARKVLVYSHARMMSVPAPAEDEEKIQLPDEMNVEIPSETTAEQGVSAEIVTRSDEAPEIVPDPEIVAAVSSEEEDVPENEEDESERKGQLSAVDQEVKKNGVPLCDPSFSEERVPREVSYQRGDGTPRPIELPEPLQEKKGFPESVKGRDAAWPALKEDPSSD